MQIPSINTLQMLKAMSERNLYSQGTIIGGEKCLFLAIFPRKMTLNFFKLQFMTKYNRFILLSV